MLGMSKDGNSGSGRRAFWYFGLEILALSVIIIPAQRILNKSDVPGERLYDPIAGIAIAALIIVGSVVVLYRYFKRTEEHDLIAHLWALALAYLAFAIIKAVWRLLHDSSVLGPMNEQTAFGLSLMFGCVVWAWHKFR